MTRFAPWSGLIVVVAVGLAGCAPPVDNPSNPGDEPATPKIVATDVVRELTVTDQLELSAEVVPWAAVTVTAEGTGRVRRVAAEIGDRVEEAQVLAELDDVEVRAQLAQAEAQLERARAALRQAELDLERGQRLAETSDISRGELDTLALARDTAAASATEAEASVTLARDRAEDSEIRSPFAGVVSDRMAEVGSWLAPGSPVFRVVDDRRLKVRAAASQLDRARLRPGLEVRVRAHALPGESFAGRIRALGAESDQITGTYLVEAAVERPLADSGARLLAGMQGSMQVTMGTTDGLFVPRSALIETDDSATVFVVEGDRARAVRPSLGLMTPDEAQVLAGLEAGDVVITLGQHMLADGDRVEIRGR